MNDPVKGKTDAGRRREQRAHRTRARIVDAALRLFLDQGYLATTVVQIAEMARVAPATVYQAFGSKQAVLARALDTAITGDAEAVALLDRDWVAAARNEPSARTRLAALIRGAAGIAIRTAPLKEVMRDAAAAEPRVRELIQEDHLRRRRTQRALVEIAVGTESLRPGITIDQAADSFFMLVNSDCYSLARATLGWSATQWQDWLIDGLGRQILGDDTSRPGAPEMGTP